MIKKLLATSFLFLSSTVMGAGEPTQVFQNLAFNPGCENAINGYTKGGTSSLSLENGATIGNGS
jgi:hypothetical protein